MQTHKDKGFLKGRIRYLLENRKLKNKSENVVNSYFKIFSTDPAIINDSDLSNKSNDNIGMTLMVRNLSRTHRSSEIN